MTRENPPQWPILLLLAVCCGCGRAAPPLPAPVTAAAASPVSSLCPADGDSFLHARLRGALDMDIDWNSGALVCEGGVRPDGSGVRATFAGPAPAAEGGAVPRTLRFIYGIRLADSDPGTAEALPTNLTVILEGEQTLFATQGDDKCAVEIVSRRPLLASGEGLERLQVRGYCTEPASDAGGTQRLLVSTFEFAGVIRTGEMP